jgi:hypothetical protein
MACRFPQPLCSLPRLVSLALHKCQLGEYGEALPLELASLLNLLHLDLNECGLRLVSTGRPEGFLAGPGHPGCSSMHVWRAG